jgi:hypothetical protein
MSENRRKKNRMFVFAFRVQQMILRLFFGKLCAANANDS